MIVKSFRDSRDGNEYNNKSKEGNDVTKYILMSLAIIAIVETLVSTRNAILRTVALNDSDQSLNSASLCKANTLNYEQLGYYMGGASQFNAVIDACIIGIGK